MNPHQSSYRMIKKRTLFVLLAFILLLALCAAQALRAKELLDLALDGRRARNASEPESNAYSGFQLREQMNSSQAAARVNGWLTVAETYDVELHTGKNSLRATVYGAIGAQEDAPFAIVLHGGAGSDRMQVQDVACELSLHGYRVLTPDAYAHGKSDGRYASLGLREAQDLSAWIDWILLQEPQARIVLLGYDEGAAAVLEALGEGLPDAVCAVVSDSAYAGVEQCALQRLQEKLGRVSGLDWKLFCAAYRIVHGLNIRKGDLAQRVACANRPLLLIHGTGDREIPAWHSEDLALAAGENAQLLYIEGASHAMGRFADPDLYYGTLFSFFNEALKNPS